jgi:hypothetical protein
LWPLYRGKQTYCAGFEEFFYREMWEGRVVVIKRERERGGEGERVK